MTNGDKIKKNRRQQKAKRITKERQLQNQQLEERNQNH